ncbi:unnamed protein product [Symbiodinium sp. CCMP2592]|nr:unnamed protein product [Symbiodinium sp. CCMP2592]
MQAAPTCQVCSCRIAFSNSRRRLHKRGHAIANSTVHKADDDGISWSPGGAARSQGFPGPATSEAAFNLASGQQTMKVGKYKGKTFTEIYAQDPQYCRWACEIALTGEKTTDSLKIFAAFVQHRWLLAIRDLFRESRPNSLRSHRFVPGSAVGLEILSCPTNTNGQFSRIHTVWSYMKVSAACSVCDMHDLLHSRSLSSLSICVACSLSAASVTCDYLVISVCIMIWAVFVVAAC